MTHDSDPANKLERERVYEVMKGGAWWTLFDLQREVESRFGCRYSDSSISARVRDFRKEMFGGYEVKKRQIGGRVFEYRLIVIEAPRQPRQLAMEMPHA